MPDDSRSHSYSESCDRFRFRTKTSYCIELKNWIEFQNDNVHNQSPRFNWWVKAPGYLHPSFQNCNVGTLILSLCIWDPSNGSPWATLRFLLQTTIIIFPNNKQKSLRKHFPCHQKGCWAVLYSLSRVHKKLTTVSLNSAHFLLQWAAAIIILVVSQWTAI